MIKLENSGKPLSYPDFDNEIPIIKTKRVKIIDLIKSIQEIHSKNKI